MYNPVSEKGISPVSSCRTSIRHPGGWCFSEEVKLFVGSYSQWLIHTKPNSIMTGITAWVPVVRDQWMDRRRLAGLVS